MKRFIASVLSATMLVSAAMPISVNALAQPEGAGEPLFINVQASIMEVNETYNQVTVRTVRDNDIIILNISDDTFVVDSVNGLNTDLNERLNNVVEVYHSPIMSRSNPPVTNALALIINIPADYLPPRFHIVERIASHDGDLRVSVDNGGMIVTLSGEGDITAPLTTSTGASADLSKIREGSKLMLWYMAVATSHPAQTTATRAVLLTHENESKDYEFTSNESDEYDMSELEQEETGSIETTETKAGYVLHMSGTHELAGEIWIPLRQVAEGLGHTVIWSEADHSVEIVLRGGNSLRVVISENAQLIDEITYVSIGFFEQHSERVEQVEDTILFY